MIGKKVLFRNGIKNLEGIVIDKVRVSSGYNNIDYYVIIDNTRNIHIVSPYDIEKIMIVIE